MEPRGESAVLIFPRDVSVNRERERCGPRGGDGLGSSFGSAILPAFLQTERSPLPAVGTVITPLLNRCVAFAFGIPCFLGTQSRTLEAHFPLSFQPLARRPMKKVPFASAPLGLFLPTTAVGERSDREPIGR